MAAFIQIIEFQTSRIDEVVKLGQDFRESMMSGDSSGGPVRVTITGDRDRANTYLNIVEFDSYDVAMANSERPETGQFAEQMAKLCDGPPKFINLDVRDSFTG